MHDLSITCSDIGKNNFLETVPVFIVKHFKSWYNLIRSLSNIRNQESHQNIDFWTAGSSSWNVSTKNWVERSLIRTLTFGLLDQALGMCLPRFDFKWILVMVIGGGECRDIIYTYLHLYVINTEHLPSMLSIH